MAKIFVSYARKDAAVAEDLYTIFARLGHIVYVDKKTLTTGENYTPELMEQMNACDVFVFLISPDSCLKTCYTQVELSYIEPRWLKRQCELVAAMIRDTPKDQICSMIRQATYLTCIENPAPVITQHILQKVDPRTKHPDTLNDALMQIGAATFERTALLLYFRLHRALRTAVVGLLVLGLLYFWLLLPARVEGVAKNSASAKVKWKGEISFHTRHGIQSTQLNEATGSWSVPLHTYVPFLSMPITIKIGDQADARDYELSIPYWLIMKSQFAPGTIVIVARAAPNATSQSITLEVMDRSSLVSLPIASAMAQGRPDPRSVTTAPTIEFLLKLAQGGGQRPGAGEVIGKAIPNSLNLLSFLGAIEAEYQLRLPSSWNPSTLTFSELAAKLDDYKRRQEVIKNRVLDALRPFEKDRDFWVMPRPLPDEKVSFAKESIGVSAAHKDAPPIAFHDATIWGRGNEGILFMSDGVYFRTSAFVSRGPRVTYIPYEEFSSRNFTDGPLLEVSLDKGQFFVTAGSSFSNRRLIELLNSVKQAVQVQ